MGLNIKGVGKAFSKIGGAAKGAYSKAGNAVKGAYEGAGNTIKTSYSKIGEVVGSGAYNDVAHGALRTGAKGMGAGAIAGGAIAAVDGDEDTTILGGATKGAVIGGAIGAAYGVGKATKGVGAVRGAAPKPVEAIEGSFPKGITQNAQKNLNVAENISKTKAGQYSGINETVGSNLNAAENVSKTATKQYNGVNETVNSNLNTAENISKTEVSSNPMEMTKGDFVKDLRQTLIYGNDADKKMALDYIGRRPEQYKKLVNESYGMLPREKEQMLRKAVKNNALKGETSGQTTLLDWQDQINARSQKISDFKTKVLGMDSSDKQMTLLDY